MRALTQDQDAEAGSMTVEAVVVMESLLSPKGPVYTRLEEVSLSGHEK